MRYARFREQIELNCNVLENAEKKGLIAQGLGICYLSHQAEQLDWIFWLASTISQRVAQIQLGNT